MQDLLQSEYNWNRIMQHSVEAGEFVYSSESWRRTWCHKVTFMHYWQLWLLIVCMIMLQNNTSTHPDRYQQRQMRKNTKHCLTSQNSIQYKHLINKADIGANASRGWQAVKGKAGFTAQLVRRGYIFNNTVKATKLRNKNTAITNFKHSLCLFDTLNDSNWIIP